MKLKIFKKMNLFQIITFSLFGIAFAMFLMLQVSEYMWDNHSGIMSGDEPINWGFLGDMIKHSATDSDN